MSRYRPVAARGWTLVELLVAMALSLLVLAGIAQIYLAAKRSYDIQTNLAEIQDVGRYVTELLTRDIRMAGYWDLMDINRATGGPPGSLTVLSPPPTGGCSTGNTDWGRMVTQKIFGINDTAPASSTPAYNCIATSDWLQGDVLTVRYADPVAIPAAGPFTNTRLYIRTAPFQGSVTVGDPNGNAQNTVTDPVYADHALVAHTYYVAAPIPTSCGTVPVFARKTLDSNGSPRKESLVNGVEQLQFQYGVDTAITPAIPVGDGSVNQYLDANQIQAPPCAPGVACWNQVRTVRFWALVRANCPESGYTDTTTYQLGDITYKPNDRYRRTLYSSTVALRDQEG
jgi:type IV pilus assembly protein PilW